MVELTIVPAHEVQGTDLSHCHPDEPIVVEKESREMVKGLKHVKVANTDDEPGTFECVFVAYDSDDLE